MENDKLKKFDKNAYRKVMKEIINGNIKINTDTEISSPDKLETEIVRINVEKFKSGDK